MMALVFAGLAIVLMIIAAYSIAGASKNAPRSAAGATNSATATGRRRRSIPLAVGSIVAVLLAGTAVTYAAFGFPRLPGQHNDSDAVAPTSPEALAKQLHDVPTAAGFKRLANIYFAAAQYDKAVSADHRAIELGANDAGTWSEFGESIVMANGGQVQPQALAAFTNAIGRDPHDARARFYIGMAEAQIGNLRQAVAIWRDLEKGADANAKWLPMVRQHIVAFSKEGGFDPGSIPPAPPSAIAMRLAVSSMTDALNGSGTPRAEPSPSDGNIASEASSQDAMIRAMVERLAARMKSSPNDADGWRRLAHAYNVLGEPDKARGAIAHAVRLKPNDIDVQLTLAETQKAAHFTTKP